MFKKYLFPIFIWFTISFSFAQQKTHIPDANFRDALINHPPSVNSLPSINIIATDFNTENEIATSKIENIKQLSISSKEIKSLQGIEAFTSLILLYISDNQLTNIDLSQNTGLKYLDASNNQLINLDVSSNNSLEHLLVNNNKLRSLDVGQNTINELRARNNELTNLDLSQNIASPGQYINVNSNLLTSLNLKNGRNFNLFHLHTINNPNLTCIQIDNPSRNFNDGDWRKDAHTTYSEDCTPKTHIPDSNFRDALINHSPTLNISASDFNTDNEIATLKIKNIVSFNADHKGIKSLKGIEGFTDLKILFVPRNQLTAIDLSQNKALTYLAANDNQLTSINLNQNTALEKLYLELNQIMNLDLSQNEVLKSIYISYNQLTNLNTNQNTKLESINAYNNQITSLDLSQNKALGFLNAFENKLTSIDVSQNSALSYLIINDNKLTSLDVSQNSSLLGLSADNNLLTGLDVSKNKSLSSLRINNNQLRDLNLKNGNNNILLNVNSSNNANLTCIEVDANIINNIPVNWVKETNANYSADCNTFNGISTASIGDTIWFDTDGDGIKDAGEAGLGGVTVTLDPGTPGDISDDVTTTTDANGNYLFDNLSAGNYTVTADTSTVTNLPGGVTLIQTFDNDGIGTANTSSLNLALAENNLNQDFGYGPVDICTDGAIAGIVTVNDPDADGINNVCDLDDDNDGILDTEECEVLIGETPFNVVNGNSVNFSLSPVGNGFVLDITRLDNSFNLTINGNPLTTQEIQFQQSSTPTGQNIRFKDGSKWAQGAIPQIYGFGNAINASTPILRFVIDENLDVKMYGSKVANGPLFELELFNGNSFNAFSWNANTPNNFIVSQLVNGNTYIDGRVYGIFMSCDLDGDGVDNNLDLDSDGDGCLDVEESGGIDANNDGILDGTGFDSNGLVIGGTGSYNGTNGRESFAHQMAITSAPANQTVTQGQSTTFTVVSSAEEATSYNAGIPVYATSGNANSGIQYQWYLGDPNTGGTLLTNTGVYSGTTTADLSIFDATGLDGNEYYIVLTHNENVCLLKTASATLTLVTTSIGDTIWFDTDGDGIKDAGEAGLGGATVTLDPGTPVNASDDSIATTDANGNYLFDNLPAGTYTISVDVSTVTSGIPAGKTPADLVQTYDDDGVSTPNNSTITLALGVDNLDQDFAYIVPTGGTSGGNSGGVESESLGDAISKIYVGRKKNSVPTEFLKSEANLYDKSKMKSVQPYHGKGQTMLDMFPTQLYSGNIANVTSPTDILDYTIADEVLSVDFSLDGETKGVVLGIKTSDKIYNHTKASCDRLRGAEILNIQKVQIQGYNFLMQGIKQRSGVVEYAISFATARNNNDTNYSIQTNWYVNNYTKFNDVYNFQVWSTRPADTQKLVADILNNLRSFIPVAQTEVQKFPETYASKIYRDKGELVVALRSTEEGNTADISMVELYSETANNIKHRYNTVSTEIQQNLRVDIADGYEYDALVKVDGEIEDAFYHADGNWGLDYDKRYTQIKNYFVWNDFDREYQDDEYTINRSVELQATSDYDYLTVYKSLLPGTLSADYSEYNYVAFTAKGSGLMELGLIKSSIEDWKAQYRVMVDVAEEEQTYYVPFDIFASSANQENLTAEDLTTLLFTFLPVEAQTKELDLEISDVRFTKTAIEEFTVNKIEKFENTFMAYPNPSKGNINLLLFSETITEATVTLSDITGKIIYRGKANLNAGKNELDYNFKVKAGVLLLHISSAEKDYGASKIIFR